MHPFHKEKQISFLPFVHRTDIDILLKSCYTTAVVYSRITNSTIQLKVFDLNKTSVSRFWKFLCSSTARTWNSSGQ